MRDAPILVVNAGSSSVKVALFGAGDGALLTLSVSEVGGEARLRIGADEGPCAAADHEAAIGLILDACEARGFPVARLAGTGHRVVHGGQGLTEPVILDDAAIAAIEACVPIAPLHNPANLAAIRAMRRRAPGLPQVAVFDTAFHATNPEVAVTYALPRAERDRGLRRYGFHGISFSALVRVLRARGDLPHRLLACHLGNGCSLAGILDGRSVATTMGYSPLDGLTMGTRTGGIDGNAVLRLADLHGVEKAGRILNRESGLLGLGGASDVRSLHAAGTPEARFALQHFAYWAVRHAGSMVAAMGGLDGVVFTGGIGENDPWMRKEILSGLAYLGVSSDPDANARNETVLQDATADVVILVVPADEERQIALEAQAVMAGEGG